MKPKKLDKAEIHSAVKTAIKEAVSYIESDIAPDRVLAQKYWKGETRLEWEEGRSRVVATKLRDVIRTIKPPLMRVFLQSDKPVEFIPHGPDDVGAAEQATSYAKYKFSQAGGYKKLQGAFHDALLKKTGILKVYYDASEEVDFEEYTNLTDPEFAAVLEDDGEVIEHSERQEMMEGPQGPVPVTLHDIKISYTKDTGDIRIDAVPPEEFFCDSAATSCKDFYIIGHSTETRVGDVVNMGFDFEDVIDLAGSGQSASADEEEYERNEYADETDGNSSDPSMRLILLTEAYMRMDIEGAGVPKLYRFICAGQKHEVLDYEIADEVPFAIFECDGEPHTFFGSSVADLLINEQDTATSLLRGLIDNVAMVNTPKTLYRTDSLNVDDLLNNEVGALIGCKDPMTDLREVVVPPVAGAVLPAMQYFDQVIDSKSGISKAGMGMDADALQGSTVVGTNAMVQAASAASELIARNLAEGGMSDTFRLIARLAAKHIEPGEMMRLNGEFVPVDPRAWQTDMNLEVNVGLGTGALDVRLAALREHHAWQLQIWQTYGPGNGLVNMVQIRETRAEILRLSGVHNVEKHLMPMTPQIEQQIAAEAAQKAQQQQPPSDANTQAFMAVEGQKVAAKAQNDQARLQLDARKAAAEDDRKRDEMEQDAILEAVKVGVDPRAIRALQARPRG